MHVLARLAPLAVLVAVLAGCGGTSTTPEVAGEGGDGAATEAPTMEHMDGESPHDGMSMSPSEGMKSEGMHSEGMHSDTGEDVEGAMVVEVEMVDVAFVPTTISVPAGQPIRFVFQNTGTAVHEAVIGDEHVQEEHEEAMQAGGGHDDAHGDDHHGMIPSISLDPGESGELVHTFASPGSTLIGCHVPGHYAAGMVIEVEITG